MCTRARRVGGEFATAWPPPGGGPRLGVTAAAGVPAGRARQVGPWMAASEGGEAGEDGPVKKARWHAAPLRPSEIRAVPREVRVARVLTAMHHHQLSKRVGYCSCLNFVLCGVGKELSPPMT